VPPKTRVEAVSNMGNVILIFRTRLIVKISKVLSFGFGTTKHFWAARKELCAGATSFLHRQSGAFHSLWD
jgi:hypothetical protein